MAIRRVRGQPKLQIVFKKIKAKKLKMVMSKGENVQERVTLQQRGADLRLKGREPLPDLERLN